MSTKVPDVFIALPVLNESENLPVFVQNLQNQDFRGKISLYVCVNQPDEWWINPEKVQSCHDNQRSLEFLKNIKDLHVHVIDRSSHGKGWIGKRHGVGYARKEVMDAIALQASNEDIIISLDADTAFRKKYLSTVVQNLDSHADAAALSVPYFHPLTGHDTTDRAMLRYEIYMRYYAINLFRISSPYAFTALGSAIALRVKEYNSVGGITPKMSGEDFYFLQKLRKKGKILTWNQEKVYPAARFSDRVYFGTGPAMIKGAAGDWSSYPLYNYSWFDEIRNLYDLFPELFFNDLKTPLDNFIREIFPDEPVWAKLRNNSTAVDKFVWACHQKFDGLRILQYLKWRQRQSKLSDENNLVDFLERFYPQAEILLRIHQKEDFSFSETKVELLNEIREFLAEREEECQRKRDEQ